MKYFFSFIIISLFSFGAFCQSIYVCTNNGYLKKLTITSTGVTSVDVTTCNTLVLGSIALYKNTLYGTNGTFGDVSPNGIINCKKLSFSTYGNSLTVDSTGVLYMAFFNYIYKLDPRTGSIPTLIGATPYSAGGDLVFYKGNLFLASSVGIVKIDLNNTMNSSLYIPISGAVYGLAAVAYSSTQNKIYASVLNKADFRLTDLIELDMENHTIGNTIATLPYQIYDAASDVEDGSTPKIKIDSVQQLLECPYTGNGILKVFCQNPLVDYQYVLNNSITNTTGIFTGIIPGTYDIKVKTAAETKDTTITVAAHAFDKPVITVTKVDENCDQKGQISFNINTNGSLYNIQSGTSAFPVNHIFTGLTAGSYHFSLVNLSGCAIDTFTVNINRVKCAIGIDSIIVKKVCTDLHKGNIQVYGTKHTTTTYTYLFNNSITNTTGVFNNVDPGSYPLNIKNSDSVSRDTTVTVPDYYLNKPVVNVSKTDENCDQKGQISFSTVSGNSLYNIQYGATTYPLSNVFTGLVAGGYHFNLLNKSGCLIDTFYVSLQRIKCIIGTDSIVINKVCSDLHKGNVQVYSTKHTTTSYTYLFNNSISNTNGVFSNIDPGKYLINIKNTDGLSKDTSVTVPDYYLNKPVVNVSKTDENCDQKGQISFSTASGNSLYNIQYGATTYPLSNVFTGLVAGGYHFNLLNKSGCLIDTFYVSLQRIKCIIGTDSIVINKVCSDLHKGNVQVYSTKHTTASYIYLFNNSITNITGIFNNIAPGTYTLNIKTSEGIKKDTLVTVPDYYLNKPTVVLSKTDENCDQKGQVSFSTASGNSLYNIQYAATTYPLSNIFTGLVAGGYHFNLLNKSGCLIDTFYVSLQRIKCTIGIDSMIVSKVCNGLHNGNIQIYATKHTTTSYTYLFNNNVSNTTGLFSNVVPGTYPVNIKTNEGISKDTIIIVPDFYQSRPAITMLQTDENCDQKGQISFAITGNSNLYTIQYANVTYPSSHIFTGLTAGGYRFNLLNNSGCLVDTMYVTLQRIKCTIDITSIGINKECSDVRKGNIQVNCTAHSGVTNTFTLNKVTTNQTGIFSLLNPNTYSINILTSEGVSKDTVAVIPDYYLQKPVTTYNAINQICNLPGKITVFAKQGNALFNIKAGSGSSYPSGHVFNGLRAGYHFFTVLNSQGCVVDTLTINIQFEQCSPVIFSNTFTPNADGINDAFIPNQNGRATLYKLTIFNRYGAVMFNSADIHIGWDGTNRGIPVPVGTYYWLVTYYNDDNKYTTQSGSVALIR